MVWPRICRSSCWNPPPAGKDELAGTSPIKSSGIPIPTPVMLHASTSAPATAPIVASSLENKLFKQFKKAYLEAQITGQTKINLKPRKQLPEAWFLDLYYGNLHMECYWFCQQCKDFFETTEAKRPNRILFAALFLRDLVIQQWL